MIAAPAGAFLALAPLLAEFSGFRRKASRLMLLPPVALAGLVALGLLKWPWATLLAMAALYVCTLPLSKWRHGVLGSRSLQGPRM